MPIILKPLADQVILITGASSGIGLVTARAAAKAGGRVMLVARNGAALSAVVDQIVAEGGQATFAVADVDDPAALAAAADAAVARFGAIDTWVNCAGITIYATLADTPLAEHRRMFQTNYFGVVNGATLAVEHLREQGGALITVASIASQLPSPILGAYAASKHAVKGYIDSLRMELTAADAPISVTLIKPSGIDTPIGKHAANHVEGEARIPPVVYAPELVAKAILDAATTPRRELIVGGVGALQMLLGTHFPAIFDRFARVLMWTLHDPKRPKTPGSALFAPGIGGEERSGLEVPLESSLYTAAGRHKLPIMLGAGVVVGAGAALLAWRGRTAAKQRSPGRIAGRRSAEASAARAASR